MREEMMALARDSRWSIRRLTALVLKYASELDKRIRSHLNQTNDSWRVDETYIKAECRRGNLPPPNLLVKGAWKYLYPCGRFKGQYALTT